MTTKSAARRPVPAPVERVARAVTGILGPHARMERFILETSVLAVAMAVIVVVSAFYYVDSQKVVLAEQAVYTPTFVMSGSGASGSVVSCGSDRTGRHAFVLLRFDSPGQVSLDPAQWRIVLGRSDVPGNSDEPLCVPVGRITFFSDTGYCLVVMDSVDDTPFPNEVLAVRLESKARITGGSGQVDEVAPTVAADPEAGFDGGNVLRVDVNPVAAGAGDLTRYMEGETVDVDALYRGQAASADEEALRGDCGRALADLAQARARIDEYETRAANAGVGHTGGSTVAVVESDSIDLDAQTLSRADDHGGTDIAWADTAISQGGSYAATCKAGSSGAEALAAAIEASEKDALAATFADVSWTLDGKPFDTAGLARTAAQRAEQAKADLEQAWANYVGVRKTYLDSLADLVDLEAEADAACAFKVSSTEDQLWVA